MKFFGRFRAVLFGHGRSSFVPAVLPRKSFVPEFFDLRKFLEALFELLARLELQSKILSPRCEASIAVGVRFGQLSQGPRPYSWTQPAVAREVRSQNGPLRKLVCYNAFLVPLETSRG